MSLKFDVLDLNTVCERLSSCSLDMHKWDPYFDLMCSILKSGEKKNLFWEEYLQENYLKDKNQNSAKLSFLFRKLLTNLHPLMIIICKHWFMTQEWVNLQSLLQPYGALNGLRVTELRASLFLEKRKKLKKAWTHKK